MNRFGEAAGFGGDCNPRMNSGDVLTQTSLAALVMWGGRTPLASLVRGGWRGTPPLLTPAGGGGGEPRIQGRVSDHVPTVFL